MKGASETPPESTRHNLLRRCTDEVLLRGGWLPTAAIAERVRILASLLPAVRSGRLREETFRSADGAA